MKSYRVLYDIKSLEALLVRTFIGDMIVQNEESKNFPTPTQMQIIEYIMNVDSEDVYQRDLENVLNLRRATVSGVLQTMEKNSLIERISSEKDARVKKVILKPQTRALFLEHKNKLEELEALVTKDISISDLENFSNVLKHMKMNVNDYLLSRHESIALRKEDQ